MKSKRTLIHRREFLAGFAGAAGAGAIGLLPSLASAVQISIVPGPSLFYWNGAQFVPAASVSASSVSNDTISVRISGYGTSHNIGTIDVQMPGGLFHAFTAQPAGLQTTQFTVPVTASSGLTLIVTSGRNTWRYILEPGAGNALKLNPGTYMLLDPGVPGTSFVLTGSSSAPVVYGDGQPVAVPYVLVTVGL